MSEISKKKTIEVNPKSTKAIYKGIIKGLEKKEIKYSTENYSWEKCVEKTLENLI